MRNLIKTVSNYKNNTNPLQWAQVHGRNELVSWKSCCTAEELSTSATVSVSISPDCGCWTSSTDCTTGLPGGGDRWISLSNSFFGWPKTASTMSFIRSSNVFFFSPETVEPSVSWSAELKRGSVMAIGSGNEIVCGDESDPDRLGVSCCVIKNPINYRIYTTDTFWYIPVLNWRLCLVLMKFALDWSARPPAIRPIKMVWSAKIGAMCPIKSIVNDEQQSFPCHKSNY